MKNKVFLPIALLLVITFQLKAQNISGSVKDIYENPLPFTSIVIKENEFSEKILLFTKANRNGEFSFDKEEIVFLKKRILYIEARLNNYAVNTRQLILNEKKLTFEINFTLNKLQVQELKEVVVQGTIPAFKVSKDTVAFKVKEYADGSEMKIEDVIKNLPGVNVNTSTGEIFYKGKSIETVTLDGDNLFGFNYTLGTRNINIDMVEQIEAIDNYAENPLLKGIEQGGKVSLNLKLKKNKTNYAGNLFLGAGMFDLDEIATDVKSTFLTTSSKLKSFMTLSQNNVGINHSPFDYFGFDLNPEQKNEQNYFAKKIIPETILTNPISLSRANINNQFFANYNAIFKLNPKLSIKTNLYYLQDRITTNQLFQNDFQINNDIFTTTDNTFITKKPKQYRGDLEIKYNTSKTSLLEYNLRLRQENIETPTKVIQNQTDEFSTFLNTEDFYLKQDLLWTKKLTDKKALQLSLFHSFNDIPQTFSITPSLFDEEVLNNTQESEFQRTFLEGKVTYLGSGKRDKYTFALGANLNFSPFKSRLFNSEETISENNFDYIQSNIFNTGTYNFNRGKWQISPSYSVRTLNQKLEQNIIINKQNQNDFIFEPALNLKYKLNLVSFLSVNLGYNQNTNAEQFFFLNQVLINNRTTISNSPSLGLQNNQRYSLLYYNNDLYNQFQLNANVSYQKSTGNFFTNQNITETTTQIKYFFLPQDNSNWNVNMQISKYIPFIESTIKLTSNYSISNFKNIVNNSDLRQNRNQILSNSFFWKTAIEIPVNFENTFTYQNSNSKNENQSAFINNSWQNTFKVIIKPNKNWFMILSSNYYLPNTKQSDEQFLFLDTTLRHRPKNKKWGASFTIRNITNENNFEQIQTSDISTTVFRSNLMQRYFLLNLTWNF